MISFLAEQKINVKHVFSQSVIRKILACLVRFFFLFLKLYNKLFFVKIKKKNSLFLISNKVKINGRKYCEK